MIWKQKSRCLCLADTNIHLKPCNGLEQLRRKEAKRRVGNIGRIENDIGMILFVKAGVVL